MPTRLWGDAQRARYGRFPDTVDDDDIARCFHLDERDRTIIAKLRGGHNRLGFALQLGAVRFLGIFPQGAGAIPPKIINTLAAQLNEYPVLSLDTYWSGRQRWRHVALIKDRYGFRDFGDAPFERFRLTRWLYALCQAGDERPGLLMERAVAWLLAERVLLPGISMLERFCARIRTRVRERRWHRMAQAFDAEQIARLDSLLSGEGGPGLIEELRRAPGRLKQSAFMQHLKRIDVIRAHALAPINDIGAPDAVVERLARSARKMRPATLIRLPEPRRSAMLAALFGTMEGIALDEAIDLFDQLVAGTVKDAAKDYAAMRMRTLRDLDNAALTLAQFGELALISVEDDAALRRARDDLVTHLGTEKVKEAIERTQKLARPSDDRHYRELCVYWKRIRKLFAELLQRVEFTGAPGAEPVLEALTFLSSTSDWARASMRKAPTICISGAWSRHVFAEEARHPGATVADNRAYVFAVLEAHP